MNQASHRYKIKEITSLANPIIKDIRALLTKKHRKARGLFLAEGLKILLEAVDLGWQIETLLYAPEHFDNKPSQKLINHVLHSGGKIIQTSEKILSTLTRKDNTQTFLGVLKVNLCRLEDLKLEEGEAYIALDRVRDPGNLGTIIRTADAVGVKAIILIGDCTDPFSLEAVRASMGSLFAVPLFKIEEKEFLLWKEKEKKALFIGTHLKGAIDYRSLPACSKAKVLLMGNEKTGLSEELSKKCDYLIRIPQRGRADSLNISVATAITLYELLKEKLYL